MRSRMITKDDMSKINDEIQRDKHDNQQAVWHYLETRKPVVVVMAPACTPFGPFSNLNYHNAYET